MPIQLNDSIGAFKAATGPNPSSGSSLASGLLSKQGAGGKTAVNQGVSGPGANTPSQPAQAQPATPIGQGTTYDYSSDPALQMVMAQQQLAITQAQSAALAQQKAALIAYGDPNLAMAILGDQATATAAQNNTGSTLATLAAQNQQTVRNTNETENKANLFYSSDRGYQLGLAQQAYLQQQGQAASAVQGNLGTIQNNLLAAEQSAYNAEAQAQMDAYNRALQNPIGIPSTNAAAPAASMGTNQYGGANPAVAPGTPAPATKTAPYTTTVTANKTGGSANKTQGTFAIH